MVLSGCASALRPIPPETSASDRFDRAEDALLRAQELTATFEISAQGQTNAHLTGTIRLLAGNALRLVAEGNIGPDSVQLELDSRDETGTLRSITKGASVSSHREPPAPKLREAVVLGLTRLGLLHQLSALSKDQPIEKAEGGFSDWVKTIRRIEGPPQENCRAVDFKMEIAGKEMGNASICVADATGLVLKRNQVSGDLTVKETFTWENLPASSR